VKLSYDPEPSDRYPHGYWYAATDDGGYDADGDSPSSVMAALTGVLEQALAEAKESAEASAIQIAAVPSDYDGPITVTLRVTIEREPTNEAVAAWYPHPAAVASHVRDVMRGRDLDTGWRVVDVT
jgi:hypothetical protein